MLPRYPFNSMPSLTRYLRERDLVLITINSIIGAGIFGLPGRLYALTGPWSLVACAACAAFAALVVLCFAEVGSRFRDTGGPYLYAGTAFGPAIGFQVGWLFWLSRVSSFAANANLLLSYLGAFGIEAQVGWLRSTILIGAVLIFATVNCLGIRNAALVNNVLTLGKLLPISLFCIAGLFAIAPARLALGAPPAMAPFSTSVLLLVYAFTGFEMTTAPSGEMRDPRRSLPRALLIAIASVAVIYLAIQAVCIGVLPGLASSSRPVADASELFLGHRGAVLIAAGVAVSITGNLHITMLAASRVVFAMAEHRQLSTRLARTNPRSHAPVAAVLVTAAVMLVMALMGSFIGALTISTVARLLVYVSTCGALPVLRRRPAITGAAFTVPGGWLVSVTAMVVSAWLLIHAPLQELLPVSGAVAVGLIVFSLARRAELTETR